MAGLTLTLAPEFGGAAFGPFPAGTVALGSDASRCHVVLDAALGIAPVHALVTPRAGAYAVQPAEAGAAIWVVPPNGRARALTPGALVRDGDAIALGGPQGPRFVVGSLASDRSASGGLASRGGRGLPTGSALAAEVRRQASTAFGSGPFAWVNRLVFAGRSGALLQPRYVVGAIVAVGALAFSGCAGLVALVFGTG